MKFWFITMRLSGTRFWVKQFDTIGLHGQYRMLHLKQIYLPAVLNAVASDAPILTCFRPQEAIEASYKLRFGHAMGLEHEWNTWQEIIKPNAQVVLDTHADVETKGRHLAQIAGWCKLPIECLEKITDGSLSEHVGSGV